MSQPISPRTAHQPRSRRHSWASTLVAPGAFLLALPLASCGANTARLEGVPLSAVAFQSDQVADDLAVTWSQIVGTPTERNQLEREIYSRFHLPLQSCMADHGWNYSPPPFFEPYSDLSQIPLPSSAWMLRPLADDQNADGPLSAIESVQREAQEQEVLAQHANPGFESLKDSKDRSRYLDTLNSCQPKLDTYAGLTEETIDQALRAEFEALVESAITDDDVRAYANCLHAGNVQADTVHELDALLEADARAAFEAAGGALEASTGALATVPAATRQLEREYAKADESCRSERRTNALLRLGQPLDEFKLKHAAELATADASWATIGRGDDAD